MLGRGPQKRLNDMVCVYCVRVRVFSSVGGGRDDCFCGSGSVIISPHRTHTALFHAAVYYVLLLYGFDGTFHHL